VSDASNDITIHGYIEPTMQEAYSDGWVNAEIMLRAEIEQLTKERDRYKREAENRARWTERTMPQIRLARVRRERRIFRLRRLIADIRYAGAKDYEELLTYRTALERIASTLDPEPAFEIARAALVERSIG
jgi:hypothetical protein